MAWARECFDLGTATRLWMMAEEFLAKADEIDAECEAAFEPYSGRALPEHCDPALKLIVPIVQHHFDMAADA